MYFCFGCDINKTTHSNNPSGRSESGKEVHAMGATIFVQMAQQRRPTVAAKRSGDSLRSGNEVTHDGTQGLCFRSTSKGYLVCYCLSLFGENYSPSLHTNL